MSQTVRTLFGHPIRAETTAEFYPDKMTLDEFIDHMHSSLDGYAHNMKAVGNIMAIEPQYIESLAESFLAWSEIEDEWPRKGSSV